MSFEHTWYTKTKYSYIFVLRPLFFKYSNIITFETLWKHIKPGGLYVVEDIQTSYWPNGEIYGYPINAGLSAPSPRNALQRFKQYADVINRGYWGEQNEGFSYFEGDHEIEEIGFSRNIIFIRKALDSSAVDATGNPYHHYPTIPVGAKSQGSMITQDLNQAMFIFQEQSKELDPWRTAPSFQQAMAANEWVRASGGKIEVVSK